MYEVSRGFDSSNMDDSDEVVNLLKEGFGGIQKVHVVDADPEAHDNLIRRMRTSTFKVNVVNAYHDIVMPMIEELQLMSLAQRRVEARNHLETTLYLSQMIELLHANNSGDETGGRSIILATQRFFRKPIWMHLGNVLANTTKLMTSIAWKTLFGASGKQTVEERILTAIQQQTEFFRTGEIRQERGFFKRLVSGGLVGGMGMMMEGVVKDVFNISRDNAQLREIQRKNGEEISNNISDKLSELLFNSSVNKQGRQSGMLGWNPNKTATEKEYEKRATGEGEPQEEILNVLTQSEAILIGQEKHLSDLVNGVGSLVRVTETENAFSMRQTNFMREAGLQRESEQKREKEIYNLIKKDYQVSKSLEKTNKVLVKEAVKARYARFLQTMFSLGNMMVNTVRGIMDTLLTLPTTLASALGGLGIGSMMGKMGGAAAGAGALLGKGALLGSVGYVSFKLGSLIYENFLQGTDGANFIGKMIDETIKKLGFTTATSTAEDKEKSYMERLLRGTLNPVLVKMYDHMKDFEPNTSGARRRRRRGRNYNDGQLTPDETYVEQSSRNVNVRGDMFGGDLKSFLNEYMSPDGDSSLLSEQKKMNKNIEELIMIEKTKQDSDLNGNTPFPVGLDSGLIMDIYQGVN